MMCAQRFTHTQAFRDQTPVLRACGDIASQTPEPQLHGVQTEGLPAGEMQAVRPPFARLLTSEEHVPGYARRLPGVAQHRCKIVWLTGCLAVLTPPSGGGSASLVSQACTAESGHKPMYGWGHELEYMHHAALR